MAVLVLPDQYLMKVGFTRVCRPVYQSNKRFYNELGNETGRKAKKMKITIQRILAVGATGIATHALAQGATEYELNIERQPVVGALNQVSKQTGLQVGFLGGGLEALPVVGPVNGRYTPESALAMLLRPAGLSFEMVNERTIAVVAPHSRRSLRSDASPALPTSHVVRFSDADNVHVKSTPRSGGSEQYSFVPPRDVEEVIVTAQKREERLQDVPISISVLGGQQLDQARVEGITEALTRVPGVATMVAFQGGGTQLAIRGVAAAGPTFAGSSPVAYYLDSVPFGLVKSSFAPDANAYDLNSVEVLRGPQGTLYGANSLNGVVRVLTKDADLNDFEAKARTSGSTTKAGGENYRADLALNAPLVEGKLGARLVVGYQNLSGWIDRPNKRDANDTEVGTMRLKINAQPTEQLSVGLSAWISRSDFGAPPVGNEGARHPSIVDESIQTDYDVYGLKLGYDLHDVSISSSTSYLTYNNDGALDLSLIGLPNTTLQTRFDADVFSQELNLSSVGAGAWRWTFGGIYRDGEDRNYQYRRQYVQPGDWICASESFAVYGELTRLFADGKVELTGGLRYFEDKVRDIEYSRSTGIAAADRVRSKNDFDAVSPRVVLTWHSTDDLTAYASYSEGFRSGLDQSPAVKAAAPSLPVVEADTLKNYEIGVKSVLFGGALTLDTAVYHIDWRDIQLPLTVKILGSYFDAVVNSESAKGLGVDFSAVIQPSDHFEFGVNLSWNDLQLDRDVYSTDAKLFDKNDRIDSSPEYTAGASADYSFAIGPGGWDGRLSASANYVSKLTSRFLDGSSLLVDTGDSMLIARTSISLSSPKNWVTTLFVDNVNNENGAALRTPYTSAWALRTRPRTIGAQLEYRFE